MFNPKENLLDQQLAASGLEMNITWAGVGAITSVVGGIFGASSASRQNAEARKAQHSPSTRSPSVTTTTFTLSLVTLRRISSR